MAAGRRPLRLARIKSGVATPDQVRGRLSPVNGGGSTGRDALHRFRVLALLQAIGLVAVLGGCGGKPMAFPAPESELGPRPGLFSGETGSFEVPIVPAAPPAKTGAPK